MSELIASRGWQFWLRLKDALRRICGRSMETLHAPALLCEFEFVDPETDETIYLFTGELTAVLCIGSRRLYFDRVTGALDGTSAPANSVAGRLELRD